MSLLDFVCLLVRDDPSRTRCPFLHFFGSLKFGWIFWASLSSRDGPLVTTRHRNRLLSCLLSLLLKQNKIGFIQREYFEKFCGFLVSYIMIYGFQYQNNGKPTLIQIRRYPIYSIFAKNLGLKPLSNTSFIHQIGIWSIYCIIENITHPFLISSLIVIQLWFSLHPHCRHPFCHIFSNTIIIWNIPKIQ